MKPATMTVLVTPKAGPNVTLVCVPAPPEPALPADATTADILAYCVCSREGEPCGGKEYADTIAEAVALWVELGTRRYDLWALARVAAPVAHDVEARWHCGAGMWEAWKPVAADAAGVRVVRPVNPPSFAEVSACMSFCLGAVKGIGDSIRDGSFDASRTATLCDTIWNTGEPLVARLEAAKGVQS